jgi:outer membrane protein assembly factor BamB
VRTSPTVASCGAGSSQSCVFVATGRVTRDNSFNLMHAVDTDTFSRVATFPVIVPGGHGGGVTSPAVTPDGGVWFGSFDGGVIRWNRTERIGMTGPVTAAPATWVGDSSLIVPSNDGNLYRIDTITGAIIWKVNFSISINTSTPAISCCPGGKARIYVGDDFGGLHVLDMTDGSQIWSAGFGIPGGIGPVAVTPNETILIGIGRSVLGIDGVKHTVRWSFPTDGVVLGGVSTGPDGSIYFGTLAGTVYALK